MILLSPLYLLLTLYVAVFMGLPVLFSQERIGMGEKPFKLYKFRSMTNKKDEEGNLLPESERLTKAGIFLRNSSLDELPELWSTSDGFRSTFEVYLSSSFMLRSTDFGIPVSA